MTSEWADVSVGVLEGKPDWNTLVIRTQTGDQLVKDACSAGYLETKPLPAENFKHLCIAAANKKKRALIRARDQGLLNTTATDQHSVLRLRSEVVERIIENDVEERCHTS
jgi:coenzyme F420-reducing hydrogenase beta subunit